MNVTRLVPAHGESTVADVLAGLAGTRDDRPRPFDDRVLACAAALSQALFRDPEAKGYPELQALAFWLRRAELATMADAFGALETDASLLVPQGTVLHFPPANVDTLFVYSWMLALLTGNQSIVRLSGRESPVAALLGRLLRDLAQRPEGRPVAEHTVMLTYGHDAEITSALSAACDLRVIWGGDASVAAIRAAPLPPHATEIAFPDRYSLAVLDGNAVRALDADGLAALAEQVYNDVYWFDQMGCSSPRLVAWRADADAARAAAARLEDALAGVVRRRGYRVETGLALAKMTYAYSAVAGGPVRTLRTAGNELTVLELEALDIPDAAHCGGGLLLHAAVPALEALTPIITRRFQTVTHFGIDPDDLRGWVRQLNGRGVDRVVPVGQALAFHRFWDGHDLLQVMTRRVHVPA